MCKMQSKISRFSPMNPKQNQILSIHNSFPSLAKAPISWLSLRICRDPFLLTQDKMNVRAKTTDTGHTFRFKSRTGKALIT